MLFYLLKANNAIEAFVQGAITFIFLGLIIFAFSGIKRLFKKKKEDEKI